MWSENSSLHLKFNKFIYTNVQPSSKYYMKDKNLKRFHIIVCFFFSWGCDCNTTPLVMSLVARLLRVFISILLYFLQILIPFFVLVFGKG